MKRIRNSVTVLMNLVQENLNAVNAFTITGGTGNCQHAFSIIKPKAPMTVQYVISSG